MKKYEVVGIAPVDIDMDSEERLSVDAEREDAAEIKMASPL